MEAATVARAVLLLGASMRLTRFVVADDVPGQWWIKDPADRAIERHARRHHFRPQRLDERVPALSEQDVRRRIDRLRRILPGYDDGDLSKLARSGWEPCHLEEYRQGLDCPYCVGQWVALGVVAVEVASAVLDTRARAHGRSSRLRASWTALIGALTLNETAAHLGARLGDTAD